MQLIKETVLNLQPVDKYGRKEGKIRKDGTIVDNYGKRTGKIK